MDDLLLQRAKSDAARQRERFAIDIVQNAKDLVQICRDTIIGSGRALSHRPTFAPAVIRNYKPPSMRAEDKIRTLEDDISDFCERRAGKSVGSIIGPATMFLQAVRVLLQLLAMPTSIVTDSQLENAWQKMKQHVVQLMSSMDSWIAMEQSKEDAHVDDSVQRISAQISTAADELTSLVEDCTEEKYAEVSYRCSTHLNDLAGLALKRHLFSQAASVREASFLFLSSSKLYFRTRTDLSKSEMLKYRSHLARVIDSSLFVSPAEDTSASIFGPRKPANSGDNDILHVVRRNRAESHHYAAIYNRTPLAARVSSSLMLLGKLQRFVRGWVLRRRWFRTVENYSASPASNSSRKRFRCYHEIISSERIYIANLKVALEIFRPPLKRGVVKPFNDAEVDRLFSNMPALQELSRNIMTEFTRRLQHNPVSQNIGDIFLKMIAWLQLYATYVSNFDSATALLRQVQKRQGFGAYLSQCIVEADSKNDLGAYLIMPVQRIPRYELMLKTLLSYTPEDHVDYGNLNAALKAVKEVNDKVDSTGPTTPRGGNVTPRTSNSQRDVSGAPQAISPVSSGSTRKISIPAVIPEPIRPVAPLPEVLKLPSIPPSPSGSRRGSEITGQAPLPPVLSPRLTQSQPIAQRSLYSSGSHNDTLPPPLNLAAIAAAAAASPRLPPPLYPPSPRSTPPLSPVRSPGGSRVVSLGSQRMQRLVNDEVPLLCAINFSSTAHPVECRLTFRAEKLVVRLLPSGGESEIEFALSDYSTLREALPEAAGEYRFAFGLSPAQGPSITFFARLAAEREAWLSKLRWTIRQTELKQLLEESSDVLNLRKNA